MMPAAAFLLALLAQAPTAPEGARVELPEGPAARTWALVSGSEKTPPLRVVAEPNPDLWKDDAAWLAWSKSVLAAADAGEAAPHARVQLALTALAQGRSEDAWDHFAALSAQPALAQALLPAFLPGVPLQGEVTGLGAPLPDGVLLSPALPPADVPARELLRGMGRLQVRSMALHGLRVGAATLAMHVRMQPDGIEVEFAHVAGPRARVRVRMPVPVDFRGERVYLDWDEAGDVGTPVEVTLEPESQPRVVFLRVRQRALTWTVKLPKELPLGLREEGILVLAPEEGIARAQGLAKALAQVLQLPARASAQPPAPARPAWPGVLVDLRGPDERKLAGLMSLVEQHALGQAQKALQAR